MHQICLKKFINITIKYMICLRCLISTSMLFISCFNCGVFAKLVLLTFASKSCTSNMLTVKFAQTPDELRMAYEVRWEVLRKIVVKTGIYVPLWCQYLLRCGDAGESVFRQRWSVGALERWSVRSCGRYLTV